MNKDRASLNPVPLVLNPVRHVITRITFPPIVVTSNLLVNVILNYSHLSIDSDDS